ncbi:MAG TPA: LysM peptidoglycan-binding domain-containing M23 family metallopeptidase [Anaerolineales bacterium]|nr:LysM peptidoglycan-binding domain-containing M23 family metallopeptidase [Anaerolineales bacterium]
MRKLRLMIAAVLVILGILAAACAGEEPAGNQSAAVQTTQANPETDPADIHLSALPLQESGFEGGVRRYANLKTIIPNRPRAGVTTYTVQTGDNLFVIAEKYNLKPETVLWGNYEVLRDNPQFLQPGQELVILPTDGVYYQWNEGDKLEGVANFFKVEAEDILDWPGNQLDLAALAQGQAQIEPGSWLIVPGGRRELKDWGPPAITRNNPAAAAYYGSGYCGNVYEGAIGTGIFVWPTSATFLSGYDYSPSLHPGIDIAGSVGNAIFATDSGVVVFAGWSEFGYGYLIVLDHGNGWQSAYAHLSAVGVSCGQSVGRGTVIGGLGSSGNSSGPHLHFELRSDIYGKVNPWDYVSP